MKHLILDVNIVLDMWLKRGDYKIIDNMLERCAEQKVQVWFPASGLGTADYVLVRELARTGVPKKEAKEISRQLSMLLLADVTLLSCFGFEQHSAIKDAYDLEDAQITLATASIQGEKRLVTHDKTFDTLGLLETAEPAQALEWIKQGTAGPVAFIDLKAQQNTIRPMLEKNINKVLNHGRYILGPEVKELETQLADYAGTKYCIGVSSGTDALLMPLMAQGIGPGDAVFTTPFTFIATAEVIQLLGATSVFVDIDPRTFNLDPQKLALAIKAVKANDPSIHPLPDIAGGKPLRPKAIIPVDLFGLPADYDPIMKIASQHDLFVLADSAQGFGGEYKGQKSVSLGHAATTSFFPAKPLGCYGDGGAIFTNNDELADKLESIRVHGKGRDKYDNIRIGVNARLHTMQATILLPKLEIFPRELEAKEKIAEQYTTALNQISNTETLLPPYVPKGYQSAWAQYSILAGNTELREKVQTALKNKNIPSMVYYATPLHVQTAFANLNYQTADFPISMDTAKRIFSLPMHAYLTDSGLKQIISTLKNTI